MGALLLFIILGLSIFPHWVTHVPLLSSAHAQGQDADFVSSGSELDLLEAAVNINPHPSRAPDALLTSGSALIATNGVARDKNDHDDHATPTQSRSSGNGEIVEYEIKSGDTLSEIAESFGVSTKTLLWANGLVNASNIRPGDKLIILPVSGVQYVVKKGDTLSTLAKKFDAEADEIASFNDLDDNASLTIGRSIIIPGGELQTPAREIAKGSTRSSPAKASSRTVSFSGSNFVNPLPGGRLTQGTHGYNGADVAAPSGTPIQAAANGTVLISRDGWNGGYGNYVVIKHDNGTQTLYAHMKNRSIDSGSVSAGDVIGYVGSTGKSTGNHLHFEVRGGKNPFAL